MIKIRKSVSLFVALGCLWLAGFGLLRAQEPEIISASQLGRLEPSLGRQLAETGEGRFPVIVFMRERADLRAALSHKTALTRRQAIVQTLQTTADRSQAGVRAVLAQAVKSGQADQVRPLWIVNGVAATASRETILTLAARDEVALIRLDETITLPEFEGDEVARSDSEVEWGVARVNAPQAWQALNIDGGGVVVANIDGGVDYLHPALQMQYRGFRGEGSPALHYGNWHDSSPLGAVYPVDLDGHGSHTMGSMVGANGIGVAPGAQWIAVRAFANGLAQESWLHDAFQWVLAPAGDPALAPDVVNNSWSNSNGSSTTFMTDLEILLAAGILPVFAAGNSGPDRGTVGAPGSYDQALAVGATNIEDNIANFSSRGPSPWGQTKPEVSGPGVNILSSTPGGTYGVSNGTSMATPHVAGVLALMRQADPNLSYQAAVDILKNTATPLGTPYPNDDFGWGLVNAYSAVASAMRAGQVNGQVTDQNSGQPVTWARLTFTAHGPGNISTAYSDIDGFYDWAGAPGNYDLAVSAFGYTTQTKTGLAVLTNTVQTHNFTLQPLPTGFLKGTVTDQTSGQPISATITIADTPVSVTSNPTGGQFNIPLPTGVYTATFASPGYRVVVVPNLVIKVGQTTLQPVTMEPAPTMLLVDGGAWYGGSQIDYYRQALDELRYYYDLLQIITLPDDIPTAELLANYEVVVWSAPLDSPGFIGLDQEIQDFLEQGGRLFLSGQDVAYYDGGGSFRVRDYYWYYLLASLAADNAATEVVEAIDDELFAGLNLTIAGGDGADNQRWPDALNNRDLDVTSPVFRYDSGQTAGQRNGHCRPWRAINLGFGLEAVSDPFTRTEILARSLDWFQAGPVVDAFAATPGSETLAGAVGGLITHTLRLRNLAEVGPVDTYTLSLSGQQWTTTLLSTTVTLAPCASAVVEMVVAVPATAGWDDQDTVTLTVLAANLPGTTAVISRTSKAPAPMLLVDDDRWYDYGPQFRQALIANGFSFDVWDVRDGNPQHSPSLEVLQRYPLVIWFNGFDWFNPLIEVEEARLQAYLDGGGRLALTSQEYLYNLPGHAPSPFAIDYLGVLTHSEILSSTLAVGVASNPVGHQLGPYQLYYPPGYNNWTDTITPTATARAAMLSQDGLANAITHRGGQNETWHTAFFAFGLELLAEDDMAELMGRLVGWLSWLGASEVKTEVTRATDNEIIPYTAVLRNDGLAAIQTATFSATFPPPLSLVPGSATGGVVESNGQLVWSGPLAKNQAITFTYQAQVADNVPYGTMSRQISWLGLQEHGIRFARVAAVPINVPDWADSRLRVEPSRAGRGDVVTYTLSLINTGLADAPLVTVTNQIPPYLQVLTDTIALNADPPAGTGTILLQQLTDGLITWQSPVAVGQVVTISYAAQLMALPYPFRLTNTFKADDGFRRAETFRPGNQWSVGLEIIPETVYLPLIMKLK